MEDPSQTADRSPEDAPPPPSSGRRRSFSPMAMAVAAAVGVVAALALVFALAGDGDTATEASAGGDVELTWDGRDEAGRSLAPGAYFARLTQGEESSVTRVLRTR